MTVNELKRIIRSSGCLPPRAIADLAGVTVREVFCAMDKNAPTDPPTEKQKLIVETLWGRAYTLNAISHAAGVLPSAIFSWKKRGTVVLGKRKIPKTGLRRQWCNRPEFVTKRPGLHQCLRCQTYRCDEKQERMDKMMEEMK